MENTISYKEIFSLCKICTCTAQCPKLCIEAITDYAEEQWVDSDKRSPAFTRILQELNNTYDKNNESISCYSFKDKVIAAYVNRVQEDLGPFPSRAFFDGTITRLLDD